MGLVTDNILTGEESDKSFEQFPDVPSEGVEPPTHRF